MGPARFPVFGPSKADHEPVSDARLRTKGEYDLKFPLRFLTSAATCPPENRGLLPLQHGICVVACFLVASIPPPPHGQTPNGKHSGLWIYYSYLVYFLMWSMIMSRSGMGWHARWKTGTADGQWASGKVPWARNWRRHVARKVRY
jgi:hypothetical protein